jgi:hypothetical protein
MQVADDTRRARDRRARAARRYQPDEIRTLLVGQAPPKAKPGEPDRYFYYEDVHKHDDLFRGVARSVFGEYPERGAKPRLLAELCRRGVYLIDLKLDPIGVGPKLEQCVAGAIRRARSLRPARIILIKADVYDAAFHPMRDAGLPVIDERISFPGSGRQLEFDEQFTRALGKSSR